MKFFLIALTILTSVSRARAQSTEDSVKAVITNMFNAMRTSDTTLLASTFSKVIVFQTVGVSKEGKTFVRNEKSEEFLKQIGQTSPGDLDERIVFDAVHIDGPLASVWTSYSFYYKGQFSHCGVNSFQLVRFGDGWKIQYIIDTRRKAGCEK